jgi:NhaC family Na+:H+ antiporter
MSLDFLLAVVFFLTGLIASILWDVPIIVPLLFGLLCFAVCAFLRGHPWRNVARMAAGGMKKASGVLRVFALIGLLTGVWRACGTIPFFVWYGIKIIDPRIFILCAFGLSCVVSYALGTCFGTAGTIGVVLMLLARSGGADTALTAGAVISGAFFGDRCAPTSSSANLVATLTGTRLFDNIRNMFRTAFLPTALSLLIYLYLSLRHPMNGGDVSLLSEIPAMFNLTPVTVLPALLIFVLPPAGIDVKRALCLSILSGAAIALWAQRMSLSALARALILGYEPSASGRFAGIVAGGGLSSMLKIMGIVLVSSAYSGIFDGAELLSGVRSFLERLSCRISLFPTTVATSVATSMFACNQTLAVILTHQLMERIYERQGVSRSLLASHLEDSVILIAGLIPWSTAAATPLMMMSADIRSVPAAIFLWLVPLVNLFPRLTRKVRDTPSASLGSSP